MTTQEWFAQHPVSGRLKNFQSWSFAAVLTIIAVVIAVEFLDRPIAWVTFPVFGDLFFVRAFAGTPSFFGPIEIFILLIFVFRRIAIYPLAYPDAVLVWCEASLLATKLLLSPLKFAFGRTWPLHGHPSFLIDGAYGFNFFTAGPQFAAFPSGHTASVSALAAVLWTTYPRFRRLYGVGVAAIALALVAGDFHFLSDVLAGGFLGVSVAVLILAVWCFGKSKLRFSAVE
jgi:membrane-associated phospholipid phosphatase